MSSLKLRMRLRCGEVHPVSFRMADEQPVGPPVDAAELLTGVADRQRVDDRQQLRQVVPEEAVEEHLVAVLQRPEVDVPLEVVVQPVVADPHPLQLLVECARPVLGAAQ
jgi:hypothetical protein